MRELTYTLLDLERESRKTCDFCSNLYGEDNKSVNQILTRIKKNGEYISDDVVCEECKEKFLNNELPKCERCGRLQNSSDFDFCSHKYVCFCIRHNEDLEEKETSPSPPRESTFAFYERQINVLREEKEQLVEEVDTHLEALETSEVWNKRQKQELLDKITKLEQENGTYKKEIKRLREQLEQFTMQQFAQIEVSSKK